MRTHEILRNEAGDPEGGSASPATDTAATDTSTPPTFDTAGIFDEDGNFGEIGDRFKTEDIDADYINRNFKGKTPAQVAKILKDNQTAARAKSVAYPGMDASDEDRQRYNQAVGVPEDVNQVMPEDFEGFQKATGWTPEVATPVIQSLIDSGTPGPAITAGLEAVQKAAELQGQAWAADMEKAREEGKQAIMETFGGDTSARVGAAADAAEKLAIKSGLPEDRVNAIKEGVLSMDNPEMTLMFSHIAGEIKDAAYRGPSAAAKADEFLGPREQAMSIIEDSNHPMHEKYLSGDDGVHAHIDHLLKKAAAM